MSALFVLFPTWMWGRRARVLHTSGSLHRELESRCSPQDININMTFAHLLCCYMISDSFVFLFSWEIFLPCFGLSISGFDSGQQALSEQLDSILFSFAVIIIFHNKILQGLQVDPGTANAASLAFQVSSAVINKSSNSSLWCSMKTWPVRDGVPSQ